MLNSVSDKVAKYEWDLILSKIDLGPDAQVFNAIYYKVLPIVWNNIVDTIWNAANESQES